MGNLAKAQLIGIVLLSVEYWVKDVLVTMERNGNFTKAVRIPSSGEAYLANDIVLFAKYVRRALRNVHDDLSGKVGKKMRL